MNPYYEANRIKIYHGAAEIILPALDFHYDLAFFDPPYNVGKDYGTSKDDHDPAEYHQRLCVVCSQVKRLAEDFAVIVPNRQPGQWMCKLGAGWPVAMKIRAGNAIRRNWENKLCLLWTSIKPERRQPNVWEDLRFKGEGFFFREHTFSHPGYTPECVTRRVLSLRAFSSVIDPFCGTGTTLRVANTLGMDATGIELDERWCEIAAESLRTQQPSLITSGTVSW
jgi:DNA methylase